MIELRKLDLQLPLSALRTLGEDIENQAGPVNDPTLQAALEVTLLRGRKRMIENDEIGCMRRNLGSDLFDLAFAGEGCRIGAAPLADDIGTDIRTSRLDEQMHLFKTFRHVAFTEIELHHNRALPCGRTLKHGRQSPAAAYGRCATY